MTHHCVCKVPLILGFSVVMPAALKAGGMCAFCVSCQCVENAEYRSLGFRAEKDIGWHSVGWKSAGALVPYTAQYAQQ